jgi:predicted RNA-binding Zn-ribbon protein involved in translation (DUF1610 family)
MNNSPKPALSEDGIEKRTEYEGLRTFLDSRAKVLTDGISGEIATEDDDLTDEVCPNCGEEGVAYGSYCHQTGKPWPEPNPVEPAAPVQPISIPAVDEVVYLDDVPTDNFWEASKFAGITFSQGCQFWMMMQHLCGNGPAPGFLPASQPTPVVVSEIEPAVKLLADVMFLWVDGYISKNPNSLAEASLSSRTFDEIDKFLETKRISVDYCGWSLNYEPEWAAPVAPVVVRPIAAEIDRLQLYIRCRAYVSRTKAWELRTMAVRRPTPCSPEGDEVKILKQGKLAADEVYQGDCNHCGTEVEFQRKEARYVSDQRDGDALVVECPTCKHEIWTSVRSRMDR